jgi:hypothetical protein
LVKYTEMVGQIDLTKSKHKFILERKEYLVSKLTMILLDLPTNVL